MKTKSSIVQHKRY